MRRSDREIKSKEDIEAIVQQARVAHVGLAENNIPYVVPVNFGYTLGRLYFHCASEGRKLDIIRQNGNVCFQMDIDSEVVRTDSIVCNVTCRYRSVVGFGTATLVMDPEEKRTALNIILKHYGYGPRDFTQKTLERVAIVRIDIREMTGKKAGY